MSRRRTERVERIVPAVRVVEMRDLAASVETAARTALALGPALKLAAAVRTAEPMVARRHYDESIPLRRRRRPGEEMLDV
jgi:hypothetical protein